MANVSVLGLGLMGSAIAHALVNAGHRVTVWNRTSRDFSKLADAGARVVECAADAVVASELTVAVLSTYEALAEVVTTLDQQDWTDSTLLNLSTGPIDDARLMKGRLARLGIDYLDGVIPVYPRQIGGPRTQLLVSGDDRVWRMHATTIKSLGGRTTRVGEEIGAANVLEHAMPGIFFNGAMASFYEASAYAASHGVPVRSIVGIASNLVDMMKVEIELAVEQIEASDFATDQATIDTYLDAMLMIVESMRSSRFDGASFHGYVHHLKAARASGRGGLAQSALHETIMDNSSLKRAH